MLKRLTRVGALALLGLFAGVPVALAGHQVAGVKYTGHANDSSHRTITFKVSKNGKFVKDITISGDPTIKCASGGPWKRTSNPTVPISGKGGHFTATVDFKFTTGPKTTATVKVTGKFHKFGTESGTLTAHYHNTACNGSVSYSTSVS